MTLINLEDVQKLLSKISDKYQSEYTGGWIVSKIQEELKSIPPNDPIAVLKEMIENVNTKPEDPRTDAQFAILEETLSRFTKQ